MANTLKLSVPAYTMALLILNRAANKLKRTDEEEGEDEVLTFGPPHDGLPRRVDFDWRRFFDRGKIGSEVQVKMAGRQCAIKFPHPGEMGEAVVGLSLEIQEEIRGYESPAFSRLVALSHDDDEQLAQARSMAIEMQRAPVHIQFKMLRTLRRWVALHELQLWWTGAMEKALHAEFAAWGRQKQTTAVKGKREAISRDIEMLPGLANRMKNTMARKFWQVFFDTVYWEEQFVPADGVPSAFLPRGGRGEEEGQLEDPIEDDVPGDNPPGEAVADVPAEDGAVIVAEAVPVEEPEPELEVGELINDDDPRLQTDRAEDYRQMGCKIFVEPTGPIFEDGDNGYFGALMLSALGVPVVAFDTNEPDNAAYLGYAKLAGDANGTAWVNDFTRRKDAARRSLRFIRRFYHVFTWTRNVKNWLENH